MPPPRPQRRALNTCYSTMQERIPQLHMLASATLLPGWSSINRSRWPRAIRRRILHVFPRHTLISMFFWMRTAAQNSWPSGYSRERASTIVHLNPAVTQRMHDGGRAVLHPSVLYVSRDMILSLLVTNV